jgi:GTP-binding protein
VTVLQLIDLKTGPSADDRLMLDWLKSTGTPFVIAATKLDKLNKTQQKENLAALQKEVGESVPVFPLSSRTGEGVELLWSLIEKTVEAAE